MTGRIELLDVAELDFDLAPEPWPFAEDPCVAEEWARAKAENAALYDGRVLLLARRRLERRPDGQLWLSGSFVETGFSALLAWKRLGAPAQGIENAFAMAALRSADGALLMGEMAPHTSNAGQIYFPAGTPDPSDVFDGRVDFEASARRELAEETGVDPSRIEVAPGWTIVLDPPRIACMKRMTLAETAETARARIEAFLASDPLPEFSRIHVVRAKDDIDRRRTPAFVAAYAEAALSGR